MGGEFELYTVAIDSREQQPLRWQESEVCDGYITKKLEVGDYSLVGYEDILAIERKATTSELATNVNESRFDRELVKLSKYKYGFIVCEFSLEDILKFPENSGIPQRLWGKLQVTNKYLLRKIGEYQIKYNTKILFCGDKIGAWEMVNSIFKRVMELVKR